MKRQTRNYDGDGKDRLSDLPDCLLLHILSNLNVRQVVQISILSPRWKNLWKHIPVLSLSDDYSYRTPKSFAKFVSQFLSLHTDKACLQAVKVVNFECSDFIEPRLLKRIVKYVFSLNVQRLDMKVACNIEQFPLCNFSYHTLTSLKLISCKRYGSPRALFPTSLKLPALANLSMQFFSFVCTDYDYVEPFSVFKSLNTLTILFCDVFNEKNPLEESLFISSVSLVNLIIASPRNSYKFKLSTPNLCSFDFLGEPLQNLSGRNNNHGCNFSSAKHANIFLPFGTVVRDIPYPSILFSWLVELALMESLTISSTTLEVLNLIPDSWKTDFRYLSNLKLLTIETHDLSSIPNGIVDFLLQNAPAAKKVIKYRTSWRQSPRLFPQEK